MCLMNLMLSCISITVIKIYFNLFSLYSIDKILIFAGSCLLRLTRCWLKRVKTTVVGELARPRTIACRGVVGRGEVTTGLATF